MDNKTIRNILFGVLMVLILVIGLTVTFSPATESLRDDLLNMVEQPGSVFQYIQKQVERIPIFSPKPEETTEPTTEPTTEQPTTEPTTEPTTVPTESVEATETPIIDFEDNEFDTDFGGSGTETTPTIGTDVTVPVGQNQLPADPIH